ncbi:15788_t:CDS:1 [Dentiscutata heterogama]|uniref:15788_t:CDS:1 n=1 Tax=Dentiscutata heterogama TaxID=1316150 RepID=A0ACA9LH91_9GLOM|nr:15788_t:CDS:1 [Dentiscutata heterogama]
MDLSEYEMMIEKSLDDRKVSNGKRKGPSGYIFYKNKNRLNQHVAKMAYAEENDDVKAACGILAHIMHHIIKTGYYDREMFRFPPIIINESRDFRISDDNIAEKLLHQTSMPNANVSVRKDCGSDKQQSNLCTLHDLSGESRDNSNAPNDVVNITEGQQYQIFDNQEHYHDQVPGCDNFEQQSHDLCWDGHLEPNLSDTSVSPYLFRQRRINYDIVINGGALSMDVPQSDLTIDGQRSFGPEFNFNSSVPNAPIIQQLQPPSAVPNTENETGLESFHTNDLLYGNSKLYPN